MTALSANLHLMRPEWLWALLALPLIALAWHWRRRREDAWRDAVDPQLLPHLLDRGATRHGIASLLLQCLAWTIAVFALAGPSWRTLEQPLEHGGTPMVIAVDLSEATLAADLPPSRLLQARAKLAALLRERNGRPTGLIAYAGDAFTVAPLTTDTDNIALFLDALSPEIMPEAGSRASRAIEMGALLLSRAGHSRGDILLLTDHADDHAVAAATRASASGYRTSALGMGTAAGAAYRRGDGSIVHAHLDTASLSRLATAGGGKRADWNDGVQGLASLSAGTDSTRGDSGDPGALQRSDDGYWLLLPVMLLALFAFRRGAAVAVLAVCCLLPLPQAHAAEEGGLWQRADQVQHARMREGIEAFRAGKFADALRAWDGLPGAEAAYNRGNALAKEGRYEDAVAAYDDAIRQQPGMDDAIANRKAVQAAMQRRPPSGGGEQDNHPDEGEGDPGQGQGEAGEQGDAANPQDASQGEGDRDSTDRNADTSRAQKRQQEGSPPEPESAADTEAQRAADDAQRDRMQRALQQQGGEQAADGERTDGDPGRAESEAERERRQANEAWLRRIPDDPGGLLRAKFKLEHDRRNGRGGTP